ncbi:MAG TPA: addiction module protein [Gemmataceae bacterium]|nr:addiction module protein [Gemmataceae bacterium]
MPTLSDVLAAARSLSPADRILLADALWEDLPPEAWPQPSAEWLAEAQRRSAEFDAGRMKSATWAEVQARARQKADKTA